MKRLFYIIFAPFLMIILTIAVSMPQNNLIPKKLVFYTAFWMCLFLLMKCILNKIEKYFLKISNKLFFGYLVIYGIALYCIGVFFRCEPITDYKSVYDTALALAQGQFVENWDYFSMWTNNLGNLTILTFLMKMGIGLGFKDPYYFVLGWNVIQSAAVLSAIYYLVGKYDGAGVSVKWMSVAIYSMWTPVWLSTNAFYSDQMSFGGSVIAIALFVYALKDCKKKCGKWVCIVGGGFLWGIAVSAKMTAAIAVVALIISMILKPKFLKRIYKEGLILLLILFLTVSGMSLYAKNYPSKENEYRLKAPVEYWIAMGLVGNGSYADNIELVEQCNYSPNVDERKQVCREVIRKNAGNIFDYYHVTRKTSLIFGSGNIFPTSFMYPEEENFFWECAYEDGKYFWRYCCVSTSFFYSVLLLILIGVIFSAVKYEENDLAFFANLTLFGMFLFLLMWEAQNKQLYNHIPWMTVAAVYGLLRLETFLQKFTGKEQKNGRIGTK